MGQGQEGVDLIKVFSSFEEKIIDNPRIGPTHISLFAGILFTFIKREFQNPTSVYSKELMKQSKISLATYHKCIHDLQEFGFIKYVPSYNPILGSLIYIL